MKLSDLLVPKHSDIENDNNFLLELKDNIIRIDDFVDIDSFFSYLDNQNDYSNLKFSDYALINSTTKHGLYSTGKSILLRKDGVSRISSSEVFINGQTKNAHMELPFNLRPTIRLNTDAVVSAIKQGYDCFSIKYISKMGKFTKIIQFGEYPQSCVNEKLNIKLEEMFNNNALRETGKQYFGKANCSGFLVGHRFDMITNKEYEYDGKKYVRVEYTEQDSNRKKVAKWVKVEPISWIVRNYADLPQELNPTGTHKANYIDLVASKVIVGEIPYTYLLDEVMPNMMWFLSFVRCYLNGINLQGMLYRDFSNKLVRTLNADFSNCNFLTEAFDEEINIDLNNYQNNYQKKSKYEIKRDELIKKIIKKKKEIQKDSEEEKIL